MSVNTRAAKTKNNGEKRKLPSREKGRKGDKKEIFPVEKKKEGERIKREMFPIERKGMFPREEKEIFNCGPTAPPYDGIEECLPKLIRTPHRCSQSLLNKCLE